MEFLRNLQQLDPYLNTLVVAKLKDLQRRSGKVSVCIEDLTEHDELQLLREYALALYKEYRTARAMLMESMHAMSKRETLKDRVN